MKIPLPLHRFSLKKEKIAKLLGEFVDISICVTMALRATQSTARMAATLRRVARPFSTDAVVESDYKRGEIGKVSGIPEEHLSRKVKSIPIFFFCWRN